MLTATPAERRLSKKKTASVSLSSRMHGSMRWKVRTRWRNKIQERHNDSSSRKAPNVWPMRAHFWIQKLVLYVWVGNK